MEKAQNLVKAGFIPQPDDPEEKEARPSLYLNLQRPYGRVCGVSLAPAKFVQDGKYFDGRGRLVDKPMALQAEQDGK